MKPLTTAEHGLNSQRHGHAGRLPDSSRAATGASSFVPSEDFLKTAGR